MNQVIRSGILILYCSTEVGLLVNQVKIRFYALCCDKVLPVARGTATHQRERLLCRQAQYGGRKYPAQFIPPSRQGRNVLPETGCGFLFYTHIPSLTGRRELWQPVFSTNTLCLRHRGDIFLCCDKIGPCRNKGNGSSQRCAVR
jgi:hypothetical protein